MYGIFRAISYLHIVELIHDTNPQVKVIFHMKAIGH